MTTKNQSRRLVRQLGGSAVIHRGLQAYSRRVSLMESLSVKLTKQHPNKWVAVSDSEVVAVGSSMHYVLRLLAKKGIPAKESVVVFLATKPRSMIL